LLALMTHAAPNILLLDESTNHLDIDSRQALVQAINEFPGAVVLISHDPHLIELTVDRFWLVKDGRCVPFDGDLNDYKDMILKPVRSEKARGERREKAEAQSARKAGDPGELKRQVEQSAIAVQKLTEAMRLIEKKMAERSFYNEPAGV